MRFFKFLKRLISKRKIQVDIVTIFISLIVIFSLILSFFIYSRYRADILKFSQEIMQWVDKNTVAQIRNIKNQAELVAESTRGLITSEEVVSLNNSVLVAYLLNTLEFNQVVYSIEIETQ